MPSQIRVRAKQLPSAMRLLLVEARHKRGWSQAELGSRAGLPQMHISAIETGCVVPRFDTLLDLVRILDYDLLLVPREMVPVVQSIVRGGHDEEEQPLYTPDEEEDLPS